MNTLISELKERGCDIEGAMGRFLDDEEFYIQCYQTVMVDANFENLKAALENGDITAAFEAAHSLKGVIANMGLTPLYDVVVLLVEPLREGTGEGLLPICEKLLSLRDEYAALLG